MTAKKNITKSTFRSIIPDAHTTTADVLVAPDMPAASVVFFRSDIQTVGPVVNPDPLPVDGACSEVVTLRAIAEVLVPKSLVLDVLGPATTARVTATIQTATAQYKSRQRNSKQRSRSRQQQPQAETKEN